MEEKKYNIYYKTDKDIILKENVTKEQVDKFLATLTVAEVSHLRITEVGHKFKKSKFRNNEEWER